jgi:ribosomal protein L14E/L6E/L27E
VKLTKGSVIIAAAGRDSGAQFVVVDTDGCFCYIADGKSRKLDKPKRKNIKHIRITDSMIDLNDITDKKLRRLLKNTAEDE